MNKNKQLHEVKTVAEFERGYWYAKELKQFARNIGVANSSRLRKDELEEIIKTYLDSGSHPQRERTKAISWL
ncbi:MAG: SAP domain-containing protein [Thiotrichales bacterium]